MEAKAKLLVINHTFPRTQKYDLVPAINASLLNSIMYYMKHECGAEEVLHDGHWYLVSDNIALTMPLDYSSNEKGECTYASGFEVTIGGMGGEGKRDQARRCLQAIFMQEIADMDFTKGVEYGTQADSN